MLLPQQMMADDHIFHNRLIENMQHLAANTERPKHPQEVQSALSLLVDGFRVASPVQFVVQVNTEVFILLHHLHFFSHDGNSISHILVSLKIYNHLLSLYTVPCKSIHTLSKFFPPFYIKTENM
ncbi:hypothetical protein AMECASPLE_012400 [Ameca splendens]|uniref:Uncharacterized protein n=1 Tax=Ameca splendens TaxID=208324 RepID=A0ABV0Z9X4_9TELE